MKMFGIGLITFLLLAASPQGREKEEDSSKEEKHPLEEVIVVTAARREQPLMQAVSLVSVIRAEDLVQSPALVLDDLLRRIPGFSLFRRSSSRAAHPTTQGVSLRGIGPSGTSRSLVLFDGVPLNDPFGGWIYWNRFPILSLRSVEVVRGATSQLYGSSALGGTIQLITRQPSVDTLEVRGQLGNQKSYDLDLFAADRKGRWGYTASGRFFDTDGFFIIDESQRGAVDRPARSEFQTFFGRIFYGNFHAGLNVFRESRRNGTVLQKNSSSIQMFETGFEQPSWKLNFYAQSGLFKSSFSRVLPDRSMEFPTANQRFPTLGLGGSFVWQPGGQVLVGSDWRRASWNGQSQNLLGVFIQDLLLVHPRLDLLLGARLDLWENRQTQTAINPRVGMLFRASDSVTLRASGYRGFRAPTLNELYRPFRVGNIVTLANPDLDEESLWGGEGGVDFHPTEWVILRLNAFWNSLRDPVSNVTLSVSPDRISRQRRNAGRARIRGLELEANLQGGRHWEVQAAYLYSHAVFRETGLHLPQVPFQQGSLALQYKGPVMVTAEGRWVASQFEDDRNQLELGRYAVLDLLLLRSVSERFDLFFAIENVLDRQYPVGRTPIESLGTPRLLHGGLHFKFSR